MKFGCLLVCCVFALCIVSCTPDRDFPIDPPTKPIGGADSIVSGTLRINEFIASGSTLTNELESSGVDWMEIYNTTFDTIPLIGGKWFVTDSIGDATKFELPDTFITPKGYLIVFCDSRDTTITQIHTSFGLSKNGEEIGLFYKVNSDSILNIDNYTYSAQTSGISMGRLPDGGLSWEFFNNPTPQAANVQ